MSYTFGIKYTNDDAEISPIRSINIFSFLLVVVAELFTIHILNFFWRDLRTMLAALVVGAVTIWLLYRLWTSSYNYWASRGYPYIPGEFPFGTSKELITLSRFQGFTTMEMYKKMSQHAFFGIYTVRKPVLVLRDPEMVRLVMAKDFSHFRDRQDFQRSPKEFLAQHLFNLDGERWRTLRVKLSPTFTSGKLKAMFPLFVNCAEALDNHLLSKLEKAVDIKDITSSFTSDTICSCAFGIEVNALSNPNSEFKNLGIDIFSTRKSNIVKVALINIFPSITKVFVPRVLPSYMERFLFGVIKEAVDYRKNVKSKRNDFLDLLIELNEKGTVGSETKAEGEDNYGTSMEMTYEMMTAQCFVFFAAGFETSGSVQSYCLYEMAVNPDIQERVYEDICSTIEAHGELSYQAVLDMAYLDMVVHETMRKYPTLPILTRTCTKDYTFPNGYKLEKGCKVVIPVYALHHDSAYFPSPDKFEPERFSTENKHSIKPYTYLPFGEGPRICIGSRFGLLQTKMGLITLLRKYRVEKADNTPVPLKFRGSSLVTTTVGPIQLKLVMRNNSID